MSVRADIATDLVVSPFGAAATEMVDVARCAEESGFDGVHALDHFSGAMLGHPWSREPFTVLGAMAVVTDSIRLGPLVANVVNRHVALLASAASTLQSLAGGRVVLGLGTGAAPGSRFAGEHDAIGRRLLDGAGRRRFLGETIDAIGLLWSGGGHQAGEFLAIAGLHGVVGPEPRPPLIVGASGPRTVELACDRAEGVNIRVGEATGALVALARSRTAGRPFEISVHDFADLSHSSGGEAEKWADTGVQRRTLAVSAPFDLRAIAALGDRLNR